MAPHTLVQPLPSLPKVFLSRWALVPPAPPAREADARFLLAQAPPPAQRDEDDIFLLGQGKPQRKAAPSATVRDVTLFFFSFHGFPSKAPNALVLQHELRQLRADTAAMEAQLTSLRAKWQNHLPDPSVREAACAAAKAKWVSSQAELVNRSLKDQVLQQQLYLASLQHLITQSPLLARSKELFEGMHSFSALRQGSTAAQRADHLVAQCEMGVRLVPALMGRFARQHLHHVTFGNPFSHTGVMADGNFTYVSNILLCRIPHRSMEAAVGAALHYFQTLSTKLKSHLGAECELELLQDLGDARAYSQMRYRNGPNFSSSSNTTLAAHITPDAAVVVADFVDDDVCHPIDRMSEGHAGLDSCLSYVQYLVAGLLKLPPLSWLRPGGGYLEDLTFCCRNFRAGCS
ncbi:unnamed protein product [Phytophthora fragariaefolia]|uniref:Unnamed protein product n=1 Tax=Phytophthora fragariaefolia TaxID=1490495 RepID=A0A9W6XQY7_9STRA|nr:unnamed protein product [Phytophthora fragariaefolia]